VLAIEQRTGAVRTQHYRHRHRDRRLRATALGLAGEPRCPKDGGRVVSAPSTTTSGTCLPLRRRTPHAARTGPARETQLLRDGLPAAPARLPTVRLDGEIKTSTSPTSCPRHGTREIVVDLVIDRSWRQPISGRDWPTRWNWPSARAATARWCWRSPRPMPLARGALSQHSPASVRRHLRETDTATFSFTTAKARARRAAPRPPDASCRAYRTDPAKTVREGAIKPWRIGGRNLINQHNACSGSSSAVALRR